MLLGVLAGLAVGADPADGRLAEHQEGERAAELPNLAGFDADDCMIVVPIALWLGWAMPLLYLAASITPLFALFFAWKHRRFPARCCLTRATSSSRQVADKLMRDADQRMDKAVVRDRRRRPAGLGAGEHRPRPGYGFDRAGRLGNPAGAGHGLFRVHRRRRQLARRAARLTVRASVISPQFGRCGWQERC